MSRAVIAAATAARAYLALGSNLGCREERVLGAVRSLDVGGVAEVRALSPLYETEPVGMGEAPRFINAVVEVETLLSPWDLLVRLQRIERDMGRTGGHFAPREIDIDVVSHGTTILDGGALTLPHPRFAQRPFVLHPLRDIAPGFCCPRTGASIDALLERIADHSGVTRISHRGVVPPFVP